jgi:EmrB/QacA subfamily drug resistance transporter
MVILDLSIVNVALPSIQDSLSFTSNELQWVVDAYAIAFAGFLMLGGRAADRLGHRRVFVVALALFSLTSLVGGLAPDRQLLVVARGIQGFSCAFMAAGSLAIITASFAPGPALNRAIGLWAAMNGLGGAAGLLLGGLITQELSWRWVLLINPPIGLAAALVAHRVVAGRRREHGAASFDVAGAVSLTLGQMILVYGVVEAGIYGIGDWHSYGAIVVGLVLLAGFNIVELRAADPLIPFKDITRPLANANTIVVLFSAALFPMWYLCSLYLQQVLGLSPLHTGLVTFPMALVIFFVARQAGRLVSRFGVRGVLGGGLCMMTAGMLLFTKIAASGSPIVYITIPGLLMASGIALSIVPSTIAATQGARPGQAGLASGLVNTSRQVGGGLGIAVLITLATAHTSHQIGHGTPVPQALTNGFRLAFYVGAGLCAAAAMATFLTIPKPPAQAGSPGRGGSLEHGGAARRPPRRPAPIAVSLAGVIAAFVALDFAVGGSHGSPIGRYSLQNAYTFVSAPGLHPPKIRADVPTQTAKLAPGYIFMTNFYNVSFPPIEGQSGPLILDDRLQPVWFKPVPVDVVASNLSLQAYNGRPVLAYWQGFVTNTGTTITGEYVVLGEHYQTIAKLHGAAGWVLTTHALQIVGHDAWVTANKNVPVNLSRFGGAYNGAIIDSAVQEYDLRTGRLLRTWDALDHIPLADSLAVLPTNGFPWDAYHVNAVDVPGDGTFVVSMRNTWAAYKVEIRTGAIAWTLGGRRSSFRFGPGAAFSWQHDVSVYPHTNLVTLFDDHCCQINSGGTYVPPTAASRGIVLKLDPTTRTATLADAYGHGSGFDADYMGSMQPLSNGNEFVGWGAAPYMSEFSTDGRMLLDAVLPGSDLSYRAGVEPWVGLPLTRPAGAARRSHGATTVYASWNGATELAGWRVLGGTGGRLRAVATAGRAGFETAIPVPAGDDTFAVQALDAHGRAIGASRPFPVERSAVS